MRNISLGQLIIVFFVILLLFSDFSKITKNLHNLIKKRKKK